MPIKMGIKRVISVKTKSVLRLIKNLQNRPIKTTRRNEQRNRVIITNMRATHIQHAASQAEGINDGWTDRQTEQLYSCV